MGEENNTDETETDGPDAGYISGSDSQYLRDLADDLLRASGRRDTGRRDTARGWRLLAIAQRLRGDPDATVVEAQRLVEVAFDSAGLETPVDPDDSDSRYLRELADKLHPGIDTDRIHAIAQRMKLRADPSVTRLVEDVERTAAADPPLYSVRMAVAETDLPADTSSADAIRELWRRTKMADADLTLVRRQRDQEADSADRAAAERDAQDADLAAAFVNPFAVLVHLQRELGAAEGVPAQVASLAQAYAALLAEARAGDWLTGPT